ncbi:hypothetical protein AMATHDRAFT_88683 [Amanita thiersii Skay4041]|uniref:G-protein coupled receptors family 1 profile domain-containing protein n=1 Tax=Amanita thiersii Skay4041 TaxID=703135 RepID=A0A2A9ND85_9AGAR|nr:hypothetical protein AMATHDRAFT_88683 [Amanita thiersii Skay4041]
MSNVAPPVEIVAVFVQALFGGVYTATFVHCVRWLAFKDCGYILRTDIRWPLLTLTCVIFVLSMTTIFGGFAMPLITAHHPQLSELLKLALSPGASLTAILADSILIYRCWVLYDRRWHVVVFPFLMWLGYICVSGVLLYFVLPTIIDPKPSQMPHAATIVRTCILSVYLFTIAVNVYTTTFIVYRIWYVAKQSATRNSKRTLHFAMQVIAESVALYTLTSIICLVAWLFSLRFKNWDATLVFAVFGAINYYMIGITFKYLLLIRTAHQKAKSIDVMLSFSTSQFATAVDVPREEVQMQVLDFAKTKQPSCK